MKIGTSTRYASTMYLVRLATLVKAAVLARALGPGEYGVITAFATFLAYAAFLDLGMFHAQNREIPMLRGAGDHEGARRVAQAVRGGSLATGAISGALLLGLAAAQAGGVVGGTWWFTSMLALAIPVQMAAGMLHSLCYAEQRFDLQAKALGFSSLVDVAVSVPVALFVGVEGVLAVAPITSAVQWLILRRGMGRTGTVWDIGLIGTLVRTGIPIALVWVANTNLVGVDKLVVLGALGTTPLGLYSIAAVAGTLVTIGPNAISQTIAPRMLERFGRDGGEGASLELTYLAENVSGVAGGVIAGLGIVAAPWLVGWALPSYVAAVPAAQVLMAASAVFGTIHPAVAYFVGHGRQVEMAGWYFAAAAFNVVIDVVLLGLGAGLLGVACGSLVTYVALYAVVQIRTSALTDLRRLSLRGIVPLMLAVAGVLVGVTVLSVLTYGGVERTMFGGLIGSVIVLAASVPVIELAARRHQTSLVSILGGRHEG